MAGGKIIQIDGDGPSIKYVTWDANGNRLPRKLKKKYKKHPPILNFGVIDLDPELVRKLRGL